ncbi:MAG: pyridoxamine 5'-phosphate oxidase family protein [Sideroxydans sp.]|nr:pyridoxamine 5'-phosphate oxidase family protein [Sideroxydans sp.]
MITDKTAPQDHGRTARQLLRAHRYGALGTLSRKFDGHPFTSITPYMVDHDGSLLILISGLAEHTRNILGDSRVSLITHNQEDPHIQTQGRVTVVGHAVFQQDRERCGKRYLRYFPEAQTYFDMADFNFYRITPLAIRYIGGFGDIHWVKTENYHVPRNALMEEEESLLAELNAQTKVPTRQWLGVDCDGYDLKIDGKTQRKAFKEFVVTAAEARAAIVRSEN